MSTRGVIKTLFSDKEKTEALFPRTKLSAVSAEDGTGLNAIIDDLNTQLDTKATESFVTNKIAEAQLNSGGDIDLSGYATKDDLNSRVPTSRTVNGKALSSNVTLSASDVKARPNTWNPSFLPDSGNANFRNGLQYSGSPTNPLYMAVWDADDSADGTQPNRRVRSIEAEGARTLMGAASTAVATQSANGLLSAADKKKLDGIATGANAYSLPTASSSTLGGVKTTSTVTSNSGYTACPIISGVPYYKDTDTKYTHPTTSGNKHIPSGGSSGQILRWSADGTATWGWDSTGINREFGQALSVSSGTTWTYNGNTSKFYVVTVQIGSTAYRHTFVVDWQAVDAASNKQIGYYSDASGNKLNLVVNISGSSISFRPSGCNIVHICGYY